MIKYCFLFLSFGWNLCGVMANELDNNLEVSEFEL